MQAGRRAEAIKAGLGSTRHLELQKDMLVFLFLRQIVLLLCSYRITEQQISYNCLSHFFSSMKSLKNTKVAIENTPLANLSIPVFFLSQGDLLVTSLL